MRDQLSNIIDDIKHEKCILIIGPDIHDFGEKSFFEKMCDDLFSNEHHDSFFDSTPNYVFPNEELLQLKPGIKKRRVIKMMESFYKKQILFDAPLNKIAQIPFHLIISFLPDSRLKTIFTNKGLDYSYNYYPAEEVPVQISEDSYPSKKKPLIYNLTGDFEKNEAIVTFDDLFCFLSGIMGARPLPKKIQESLKYADSFIFFGVHFERWHVQLLLKQITLNGGINYSVLKNGSASSNDVCLFVRRRLEVDFLMDDPLDFLDNLYDGCHEENMLKNGSPIAKVFISYSHKDKLGMEIYNLLKSKRIEVMIDEVSMPGGQKITDFVNIIREVDFCIPVLSKNSLRSPWVMKEIQECLQYGKPLIPVCIDNELSIITSKQAEIVANDRITEINLKIIESGMAGIDNLLVERERWLEYNRSFSKILSELKSMKYYKIDNDNPNDFINGVVKDITG
ncbi:TIR domain-containing protein [Flavobacterium sp. Sd200]|uniref:toll/interleukin-1 receptor domain-containing protein n=1 Tax=Flavobacterium sp. Sd200 TaxID=2692211 RepID=UPI00136ADCE2|nr:toll/interleukin-1 receptor domain-containing protein [Flavobacterium sp. Sd200]MXN92313.1 TIR domain-containing protein [Flavobacterium sp. Sd200]